VMRVQVGCLPRKQFVSRTRHKLPRFCESRIMLAARWSAEFHRKVYPRHISGKILSALKIGRKMQPPVQSATASDVEVA
jgi:hypothetical protein